MPEDAESTAGNEAVSFEEADELACVSSDCVEGGESPFGGVGVGRLGSVGSVGNGGGDVLSPELNWLVRLGGCSDDGW